MWFKNRLIHLHHIFFILLITIQQLNGIAQDITYAKKVVDTLASEKMKGRGYVQSGSTLAATYISNEFKRCGLVPFSKNYFQAFTTPVNTFPGNMDVCINSTQLKPGIDFLVNAESPGISGTFNTVQLKADELLNPEQFMRKIQSAVKKFIVIEAYDKKKHNKEENKKIREAIEYLKSNIKNPIAGTVLLTKDKLTWDASTVQYSKPCITIKTDSLSPIIETITLNIKSKFIKNFKLQNIIGHVEGKRNDSLIVLTAHYDHLGMMGDKTMFPGANDNASGMAMLLNLANYYSQHQPEYTVVFIAFSGEELGLIGSNYFTEHPAFELKKIKFLINFDLAGTGDEGIQVVNGSIFKKQFDELSKINEQQHLLPQVKIRGEACNSDHCMFYQKKVPCFFIYTLGGIKAYHDIYDKAETLPLTEFEDYFKLMVEFVNNLSSGQN